MALEIVHHLPLVPLFLHDDFVAKMSVALPLSSVLEFLLQKVHNEDSAMNSWQAGCSCVLRAD
jgi:hypothetical protein